MPHWPKPVGLLQNETSLQRMQAILEKLGNPHLKLPKVIHVAGTNGKGSTVAFLKAVLEANGNKVHAYTTPHLIEFNERIVLAGEKISDDFLFEIMEEVRLKSEGIRLGFYEATTAGAFLAFSKVPADYLVMETGLGGRLDATNIVPNPIITILTTIDLDHIEFLGKTLQDIAFQKLHIVKEGSICISSLQYDEVNDVIENWCSSKNISHHAFNADFGIEKIESGFVYFSQGLDLAFPKPALAGDHQYINASSAVAAVLQLGVPHEKISKGIAEAEWPSRLEQIKRSYVPENWELWIDGAHNPSGAFALANFVEDNWGDKPTYLIFSTTKGRDVKSFLAKFVGKVSHLCLVKINFEPASYSGTEMLPEAQALGFETTCHDSLKEAIKFLHESKKEPARVLICGSLFFRGDL